MRKNHVPYRQMIILGMILLEALMIWLLIRQEKPISEMDWLTAYATETDAFRAMEFGEGGLAQAYTLANQWETDVYSILAAKLVREAIADENGHGDANAAGKAGWADGQKTDEKSEGFDDLRYREYRELVEQMENKKPVEWTKLVNGFRTILADVRYFPVASDTENGLSEISYENGWGDARTYGGDRLHEGTDIMDNENIRGRYPIISMSDGVIEHIGWLEQGGYRIGIRSPHGAYFYYAHLASYAEDFVVGQQIVAGQLIGFMGDTGYSAVEGTVGNFPVHLHMGIYLETDHYDELSVNPYYILKYLENRTVSYAKETYLCYTINNVWEADVRYITN